MLLMTALPPAESTSADILAAFALQVAPGALVFLFALGGWAFGRLVAFGGAR